MTMSVRHPVPMLAVGLVPRVPGELEVAQNLINVQEPSASA